MKVKPFALRPASIEEAGLFYGAFVEENRGDDFCAG